MFESWKQKGKYHLQNNMGYIVSKYSVRGKVFYSAWKPKKSFSEPSSVEKHLLGTRLTDSGEAKKLCKEHYQNR